MYELSEIKKIRKSLELTQTDLSKKAGVSQSLIAKIEAGTIDPTYTKAKKIFDTLQLLEKKDQIKIDDVINKKIITVTPDEDIKVAIKKMKRYEISQMPVLDDASVIGLLSEGTLLEAVLENKGHVVSDVMKEAPPLISKSTSIDVVSALLKHYPVVLVSENGKLVGVITKADLIEKLYSG